MSMSIKTLYSRLISSSWHLGFVENGMDGVFNENPPKIKWVKSKYNDRWFADPFILDVTDKEIILLVEESRYEKPKGRIAKLTIDRESMEIVKMDIIIETDSHLSFPNILREGDKIFLYPENAHAHHQDVYEYDSATSKATFLKTVSNDCIWDSTINDFFGKRLMFTANQNDYFLDIYEWNENEGVFFKKQQIESKIKNSRMAGAFFEYKGEIYAPFQNCERTYGGNIDLKKVTYQNGEFSFEVVKRFFSTHPKYSSGMHTMNEYKGVVVIDVIGYNHTIGKLVSKTVKLKKKIWKKTQNQ